MNGGINAVDDMSATVSQLVWLTYYHSMLALDGFHMIKDFI